MKRSLIMIFLVVFLVVFYPTAAQSSLVPDYPVTRIAISGDGTRLGVLGRTTQNTAGEVVYYADIVDAQTFQILSTVEIGTAQPNLFDVSPDASWLVYGSPFAGLYIVDTTTGEQTQIAPGGMLEINTVDWNPINGRIVHGEASAALVSVAYGQETRPILVDSGTSGVIRGVAWSSDGKKLATSASTEEIRNIQIWDETKLSSNTLVDVPSQRFSGGGGSRLKWSPFDNFLVNGQRDGFLMFDMASGQSRQFALPDGDNPIPIAWSPDETRIAATSGRDTIWIWDVASGEIVETIVVQNQFIDAMVWTDLGLIHNGYDNGLFLNGEPVTEPIPSLAVTSFTLMNAGTNAEIQTIRKS